jgi:hypothetical protein
VLVAFRKTLNRPTCFSYFRLSLVGTYFLSKPTFDYLDTVDNMVKTTYALTLFAAISLAAPVPNPDGSGNLIGAGADSSINELIGKFVPRNTEDGSVEHKNLIEEIPIIGAMLGNVSSSNIRSLLANDRPRQ